MEILTTITLWLLGITAAVTIIGIGILIYRFFKATNEFAHLTLDGFLSNKFPNADFTGACVEGDTLMFADGSTYVLDTSNQEEAAKSILKQAQAHANKQQGNKQ